MCEYYWQANNHLNKKRNCFFYNKNMYKEPEFIGILINRVVVIDLYPGGLYGVPTRCIQNQSEKCE